MYRSNSKFVMMWTGYFAWGAYKGFQCKGDHFPLPTHSLYTDRIIGGVVNGTMHVGLFPVSMYYDIRNMEKYVRGIN